MDLQGGWPTAACASARPTPAVGSRSGSSAGASSNRFEGALPSGVRPGSKVQTGNAIAPRRTWEPSGRVEATRGPGLGLAEWEKGRSVVVSVTGEVDITTA